MIINTLYGKRDEINFGHGIFRSWREPPRYHAEFAVHILLAIAFIVQLITITKNLRKFPNFTARIPFILAIVSLSLLTVVQTMSALKLRVLVLGNGALFSFLCASGLLSRYPMEIGLRLATFLILVHQRRNLLQPNPYRQNSSVLPYIRKWIFDWALVTIACLVYITYAVLGTDLCFSRNVPFTALQTYRQVIIGLLRTATIMTVLLVIDIFANLWWLYMSSWKTKSLDPVIRKLLLIAGPAFLISAVESAVFYIYIPYAQETLNFTGHDLQPVKVAHSIVEGGCRIATFAALISVMRLPAATTGTPKDAPLEPRNS